MGVGRIPAFDFTLIELREASRRCKAYRRALGMSQMQLALALSKSGIYVTLNNIGNIERNTGDRSSRVVKLILELSLPVTPPG